MYIRVLEPYLLHAFENIVGSGPKLENFSFSVNVTGAAPDWKPGFIRSNRTGLDWKRGWREGFGEKRRAYSRTLSTYICILNIQHTNNLAYLYIIIMHICTHIG